MKARDVVSFSYGAIRLRKLRSGLTTLGIVIGIAAIVALLSYTQGFQATITSQLTQGFSTDTLTVSTQRFTPGQSQGGPSNFTLYTNDTEAITALDSVKTATAIMTKQANVNASGYEMSMSITGADYAAYASMFTTTFVAANGTIPASPDNQSVVIGHSIYEPWDNGTIFAKVGDQMTLSITIRNGTETRTKNITLTVVGVLAKIGTSFMGPSDNGVYIPLSLAVDFFETKEVNYILVKLTDDSQTTIDTATTAIQNLFSDKVSVTSPTAMLQTISTSLGTVDLLLVGIASISLIVAGVGIMNIMIVSLMERTREIGILKAVGARSRTVLSMFLSEALIIGLLGGIIGIVVGWTIAYVFSGSVSGMFSFGAGRAGFNTSGSAVGSSSISITPLLTPQLILMALSFGVVVSVVFGLYPAWRASRLRPVDALRYE
jgi:putative ABC transport system permease protein